MDRDTKLRRAMQLCQNFARNLAYFRASKGFETKNEYWKAVANNFYDACILEWCKLFGNESDKYHWKKVIDDEDNFRFSMLSELKISREKWDGYWKLMIDHRNEFIAHLDLKNDMYCPELGTAMKAVTYYYSNVVKMYICGDEPCNLTAGYEKCYEDAVEVYKQMPIH